LAPFRVGGFGEVASVAGFLALGTVGAE